MGNLRRTALYEIHNKLKGQIIDFAGWQLPVTYDSIESEHNAVRNAAGLFDVSHMGEIEIKGEDASSFVQYLITNDSSKMVDNQVIYTFMCYENGGVVDDLLVYKYNNTHFLLIVNASNIEKDYEWIKEQSEKFNVDIINISDKISQIAIQGPKAQEILQKFTNFDLSNIKFFFFNDSIKINNIECIVSRTGYTGEDGFEIYVDNNDVSTIWNALIEGGKDQGLKPVGLGARDTLRFEASLPLYGNELSKEISPLEAGLGFFVKLDKENFIGKEALVKQKSEGLKRKLVGFEIDKGIARHGSEVYADDKQIGFVTTGYISPTLGKSIGLALIDAEYSILGNELNIKIRKKFRKATIISKRFYKKNYNK